jgi:class 3 adenylate cyclase
VSVSAAAAAPSGVVTFLFTDVEGSTRRWEADADGMRVSLAAHDEVLCKAIEAHGGWLFKHTGDGVCAAFASPRCAVDAAVAAQRALELPVRMGIATGEAELRGADYFGAVLNRAARVMAAGHGGQILLAESTAGLLLRLCAHTHTDPDARQADVDTALYLARRQGATLFELRAALDDVELRGQPAGAALVDAVSRMPTTSAWPELARAQVALDKIDPTTG